MLLIYIALNMYHRKKCYNKHKTITKEDPVYDEAIDKQSSTITPNPAYDLIVSTSDNDIKLSSSIAPNPSYDLVASTHTAGQPHIYDSVNAPDVSL